jgi:integrase
MGYDRRNDSATILERVRYITGEEYKKLLNAARDDEEAYMLFLVTGNLGLRGIETRRIRVEDVLDDAVVRIRTAKQGEDVIDEMSVPIEVHKKMRAWIVSRGLSRGDRLFNWSKTKSQRLWKFYAGQAGLIAPGIGNRMGRGLHSLRHMLGIRLAEANAKPAMIRNILRHRALSATLYYLHVVNPERLMNTLGAIL